MKLFNAGHTTDQTILESILPTHGRANHSFDAKPLLVIVENIINLSTQVADGILQGIQVHEESTDENIKSSNINLPFCKLKAISSKLSTRSCKLACGEVNDIEDVGHNSTLKILKKLSDYSWDAKAVLTLAAFALDYGEFCHFAPLDPQSNQLSKPLSILKGVAAFLPKKPSERQKNRIRELNSLIKNTLRVIVLIYQLENLSSQNPKDVPDSLAMENIHLAVYWAIRSVLACATSITTFITKDEDKSGNLDKLNPSVQNKINFYFNDLTTYLNKFKEQIELSDTRGFLHKLFYRNPAFRIDEVFQTMIFGKNTGLSINDIEAQTTVQLDVLQRKKVLWFFSGLEVSDYDINVLNPNNAEVTNKRIINEQYRIVWIPIVEKWTEDLKKNFETLRQKVPGHAVRYFYRIAGIKFIKEEWNFKGKPMVVVTSAEGKVEFRIDALPPFSIWEIIVPGGIYGVDSNYKDWIGPILKFINTSITTWVQEEKYFFICGGKDDTWIKKFESTAKVTFEAFSKLNEEAAKIGIELVNVGSSGSELVQKFWVGIECLFLAKVHYNNNTQQQMDLLREIQKLLCCKHDSGWAALFKGSTLVTSGYGSSMLKVLENFEEWKKNIVDPGKDLGLAFKNYHIKILKESIICHRFEIENGNEKNIPNHIVQCPDCSRVMGTFLVFKCCHGH